MLDSPPPHGGAAGDWWRRTIGEGGGNAMTGSVVTVRETGDSEGFGMGRARRARKIAATAAYGGGGLAAGIGAVGALGYGLLKVEAQMARRIVGQPFEGAPDDNGTYG